MFVDWVIFCCFCQERFIIMVVIWRFVNGIISGFIFVCVFIGMNGLIGC